MELVSAWSLLMKTVAPAIPLASSVGVMRCSLWAKPFYPSEDELYWLFVSASLLKLFCTIWGWQNASVNNHKRCSL